MTNKERRLKVLKEFRESEYVNFLKFLEAKEKEENCTTQKTTEEEKKQ